MFSCMVPIYHLRSCHDIFSSSSTHSSGHVLPRLFPFISSTITIYHFRLLSNISFSKLSHLWLCFSYLIPISHFRSCSGIFLCTLTLLCCVFHVRFPFIVSGLAVIFYSTMRSVDKEVIRWSLLASSMYFILQTVGKSPIIAHSGQKQPDNFGEISQAEA